MNIYIILNEEWKAFALRILAFYNCLSANLAMVKSKAFNKKFQDTHVTQFGE